MFWHRSDGFSFSELLIALFVFSVGIMGMMKLQVSSIQQNAFSGRMTTAVALAQRQMESLISQEMEAEGGIFDPAVNPWPLADDQLMVYSDPETNPQVGSATFKGYTVHWEITANAPIDDMATMQVRVQWPNGNNPITLISYRRR
jgi:Tfp pilus assembly protein PilV